MLPSGGALHEGTPSDNFAGSVASQSFYTSLSSDAATKSPRKTYSTLPSPDSEDHYSVIVDVNPEYENSLRERLSQENTSMKNQDPLSGWIWRYLLGVMKRI